MADLTPEQREALSEILDTLITDVLRAAYEQVTKGQSFRVVGKAKERAVAALTAALGAPE